MWAWANVCGHHQYSSCWTYGGFLCHGGTVLFWNHPFINTFIYIRYFLGLPEEDALDLLQDVLNRGENMGRLEVFVFLLMQQMETKLGKTWGYGDCSLVEVEVIELLGRVAPTTLGQIRHGEEIKPLYRVSLVSYYCRMTWLQPQRLDHVMSPPYSLSTRFSLCILGAGSKPHRGPQMNWPG